MIRKKYPVSFFNLFVLLAALLLNSCSRTDSPEEPSEKEEIPLGRLSEDVKPTHYSLSLTIDPRATRFSGHTEIDVDIATATATIWLHGKLLDVQSLKARLANGDVIVGQYQLVADIGVAKLSFGQELPTGLATLEFDYSAPFNGSLEGLYKVTNAGDDYAFTQFEATSARLAFPCFDEPVFKVPFDISLEVASDHKAVSNTPVVEETLLPNGNKLLRFQQTKPLPTYLIAFAVGPLDEVVGEDIPATALRDKTIPLRGYAVRGKGEQLRYALDNTADIVIAEESFFGNPYPYAKLDIIAVPDFSAGAMENAGAITYREQLLLLNDDSPIAQKQRFRSTHAHELAHQWFGNLVTPQWWDDIWLNEAFATWMAAKIMHQLSPADGYQQRMLSRALNIMQIDGLVSTRQIRQPVVSHDDIGAAFDGITYQKGSAVLSMLERFVGEDAFREGIQNYMKTHRFGNADARDFVRAVASTRGDLPSGQVEEAFFSFLEQPGTPLVNIKWQCDETGTAATTIAATTIAATTATTTVSIKQSRYLPLGSSGDRNKSWLLPLCVAYDQAGAKQEHCQIIGQAGGSFKLNSNVCPTYIMPNADAAGYYRWTLPQAEWETLLGAGALNDRELLAAANSLSAAFHAGQLSISNYLSLIPSFLGSSNVEVITAPLHDLYLIDDEIAGQSQQDFRDSIAEMYETVYASVSLDKNLGEGGQIRLRNIMLRLYALLVEDDELRKQLHGLATKYVGWGGDKNLHPEQLDANIRQTALEVATEMETKEFAGLLLQHFHNSQNALLREEFLRALSASQDSEILAELRSLALSEEIRDNEVRKILFPLMRNMNQRDATWQWLRTNLDSVIDRLPSWSKGAVIYLGEGFCDQSHYDEIKNELSGKISSLERGPRSLANTLEQIQLCKALVDHHKPVAQP